MLRCLLLTGLLMASIIGKSESSSRSDWNASRRHMCEAVARDVARNQQVLGRPVLSAPVANAMATVARHEFVPPELRAQAYVNHPLPIGHGQTISQPTIVALMTDLLELSPADRVLEVGTGSGYQAAVLSEVVPAGKVFTIEIVAALARTARQRLQQLGYENIRVVHGDGYRGLPDDAPFDAIMITAAAPEIPPPLIEQLKPGGRLVMPVGAEDGSQWLTVLHKNDDGEIDRRVVLPVRFVPLTRDSED